MRKTSSTNLLNETTLHAGCHIAYTLSLISGRWKTSILAQLYAGSMRYSALKRAIPNISERILTLQLKELEKDGLVQRLIYREVPARVEYRLTDKGESIWPVLRHLFYWGKQHQTEVVPQP